MTTTISILSLVALAAVAVDSDIGRPAATAPGRAALVCDYLGESPPGAEPQVFGRGVVSIEGKNTHALQFSPDGRVLVFSRYPDGTSYCMHRHKDGWTKPERTSFTGKEVSFDAITRRLFFYDQKGDLCWVGYGDDGFTAATRLNQSINTPEVEYYPSISAHGNLYFSRNSKWDHGRIMVAPPAGADFAAPVDLGDLINTGGASHGFVAPDESYLLFNSPRAGSHTRNDLWVSFRDKDGAWLAPTNLGPRINRDAMAVLCPTVSPDGKFLFFTRYQENGSGDIYWASTTVIEALRKRPESPGIPTTGLAHRSATVQFVDNGQQLGTGASWYIQLVDINGDGHLEAYFEGAIWTNDGRGHFSRSELSFGPTDRPAYFADVNGDGFVDVVCDNVVALNDGEFGFADKRRLPTTFPMMAAHLADLNRDGSIDIIVAGQYEDRVLLNDGKGNFHDTRTSLGGWSQCSYAVGDINGDRITDIYVAIPHSPPPAMLTTPDKLWLGNDQGGFSLSTHAIAPGEHRGVVLADLDANGSADLLIGDPRGAWLYLNDGKGGFADSGQRLGKGGVVAGDFDQDGNLDGFFFDGNPTDNGRPNTVWLNDGRGHFTDSGLQLGAANSTAAVVGDLNGDGRPDVIVANVKNVITKEGSGFNEVWLNTAEQ